MYKALFECTQCPGSTANVGMCAHIEGIMRTISHDTNLAKPGSQDVIGIEYDVKFAILFDNAEDIVNNLSNFENGISIVSS